MFQLVSPVSPDCATYCFSLRRQTLKEKQTNKLKNIFFFFFKESPDYLLKGNQFHVSYKEGNHDETGQNTVFLARVSPEALQGGLLFCLDNEGVAASDGGVQDSSTPGAGLLGPVWRRIRRCLKGKQL